MNNLISIVAERLEPATLLTLVLAGGITVGWVEENFVRQEDHKAAENEMTLIITNIRLSQLDQLPVLTPEQKREKARLEARQIRLDQEREEVDGAGR